MGKMIEIEQKYYCNNYDELITLLKKQGLIISNTLEEVDEYFTDINSDFIKNRTCLRLRKSNNKCLELTFKGKSKELSNNYAKYENSLKLNMNDYENIIEILNGIGYYSYCIVNKKRSTYSKEDNDIIYNVMIDNLYDVGTFVEFELLCKNKEKNMEILQEKLNIFVNNFSTLNLKSADIPYRDFVASNTYKNILPKNSFEAILLDLDGTLINSEKKFFESFRKVIYDKYHFEITLEEYENNELKMNANLIKSLKKQKIIPKDHLEIDIMQLVYSEYEEKFKELLSENEVSLNFELLKNIKKKNIKLALVTTCRRKFINLLLEKLDLYDLFEVIVAREDVNSLKPASDAYILALEKLKLKPENCIAIEDSERGIESANSANIKTIQVSDYLIHNKKSEKVDLVDKLSRILLSIINNKE